MASPYLQGFNPLPELGSLLQSGNSPVSSGLGSLDFLNNLQQTQSIDPGVMSQFGDWIKNSGFLNSTQNGITTQGWGAPALGIASGLTNAWMGAKQYNLAKDSLAASKDQFNKNFAAQQKTTNAALSDRQAARVASNPGAYQSVGDYLKQYGV